MKTLNSYTKFVNENQNPPLQIGKFAKMIDFTYIREDARKENLLEITDLVQSNKFYGLVVNQEFTDYVAYTLDGSDVKVVTTLDFPDGDSSDVDKLSMAIEAISDGTDEIDMVMYHKGIKEAHKEENEEDKQSKLDLVEGDIRAIANECHKNAVILKVIVESGLLTLDELVVACQIAAKAGADYVQTSTGTKEIGDHLRNVKEMRRVLPDYVKIKVSGGIRTLEQMNQLYPYVDRFGVSVIPK